jgi:hypothetical protein
VCTVGTATLYYDARCLDDLHAMLRSADDWVSLGSADEQKEATEGTDGFRVADRCTRVLTDRADRCGHRSVLTGR